MQDRDQIRQQNYIAHLQQLSDKELNSMLAEYDFNDPYKRLLECSCKIVNFCQSYPPKIHRQELIDTIKTRIYAYVRETDYNSENVIQMTEQLNKLISIDILIVLPRELNEQMIISIIDISRLHVLENIDRRLGMHRKQLLEKESHRRQQIVKRGNYINRCVNLLIRENITTWEKSLGLTEGEIIKSAHIQKYKMLNCPYCEGKINFDKLFTDDRGTIFYCCQTGIRKFGKTFSRGISSHYLKYPEDSVDFFLDRPMCPCCENEVVKKISLDQ